jgi:hypothetical protein
MWINLREKNEKGSFSVASHEGRPLPGLEVFIKGAVK